ncbi:MAG: GNAT family N-acetyltransferase [Firmicutes bacterium]|nr:GNAT family N-acetyltransferase [Bacillota bacterium]
MVKNVIIREIMQSDIHVIKSLIIDAFGDGWNLRRYNQDSSFFQAAMEVYLSIFLSSATFGKVAVLNEKVIGAIICGVKNDTKRLIHLQGDMASNALALLTAAEAERKDFSEHLSNSFQAIGQLLEGTSGHDGSLDFIAVTKEARGLKIGKLLWDEAVKYFKSKKCKSIYLISDSACNVGFYDHNGFDKIDKTEARYNYSNGKKKFDIFLYEYNF